MEKVSRQPSAFSLQLKPSVRGDAIGADLFEKMLALPAFAKLWARIGAERDRAAAACLREDDEMKLRRAQGAASALSAALALPAQMLAEMRQRK
jgi:hypothetical protein